MILLENKSTSNSHILNLTSGFRLVILQVPKMSSHVPPPKDVSSTSSVHTLLNEYNRFILREEDEGVIDLSGVASPTVDVDDSKSLVNRFLTDRTINFAALKQ